MRRALLVVFCVMCSSFWVVGHCVLFGVCCLVFGVFVVWSLFSGRCVLCVVVCCDCIISFVVVVCVWCVVGCV